MRVSKNNNESTLIEWKKSIDKSIPTPLYYQLKLLIKSYIESDKFKAGSPLPTESEMSRVLEISRPTIRQCMQELVSEGFLTRQKGKGTFVNRQRMPYANTDCMNVFLEELSKAYPDDYILLLLDNAAWPCSSTMVVPSHIELFPLLPYTPELNPIEMIWDEVREKGFRNEIFKNLEAVIDRLCCTVKELAEDVQCVASITHRRWFIDALMI